MIKIYTDGSSIGNPGPGGWAVLILPEEQEKGKKTIKSKKENNDALVGAGSVAGIQKKLKTLPFKPLMQESMFFQEQLSTHSLEDAHCKKYPKKTGVGEAVSLSGGDPDTTNNRMELTAVISAYLYLQQEGLNEQPVTLYMDSMYVHDGLEVYLDQWIARGRRLANKKPVLNVDLRKQLYELRNMFPQVQLERVKAHHTDKYNNFVDKLARKEAGSI